MAEKKDRLVQIVGNAGGDPKTYETSKGEVLKISVAVTMTYGDEGETRWVNVSVWNEDLQEFANENISKGTKVVAVGYLKTDREYKGVQQFDLSATELGFATMGKRSKGGSSSKPKQEKPAESEELGW